MTRAAIVTRWVQQTNPALPAGYVLAVFNGDVAPVAGDSWKDATGQPSENIPPSPNVLIVEVNCSDAVLAAIKAHGQYGNAAVLWEGDPAQSPVLTQNAYDVLVAFLANKFSVTQQAVRNVLTAQGAVVDGTQTRYDFAVKIIEYLRTRPKG